MPSIFFDKSRRKWFAQVQVDGQRFGKRFEDKGTAKRWVDELEFDLKRALRFKSYQQNGISMYNGIQKRLGHHKLFDFTTRLLEDYA